VFGGNRITWSAVILHSDSTANQCPVQDLEFIARCYILQSSPPPPHTTGCFHSYHNHGNINLDYYYVNYYVIQRVPNSYEIAQLININRLFEKFTEITEKQGALITPTVTSTSTKRLDFSKQQLDPLGQ